MNRSIILITIVISAFALIDLVRQYNLYDDIVLQKQGLQFTTVEKEKLALWPQKNDVFILQESPESQLSIYKIVAPYSGYSPMKILKQNIKNTKNEDDLFVAAIHQTLTFDDTISLDFEARKALFSKQHSLFSGRRLIQTENTSFWWKAAESAYFILPFFTLIALFFLAFLAFLDRKINPANRTKTTHTIRFIAVSILAILFFLATYDEKFSASWISAAIRIILIVFPVFFALRQFIRTNPSSRPFAGTEAVKFSILFFGTFTMVFVSTVVARWVDHAFFGASVFTALNQISFWQMVPFWGFFIALANLLFNLWQRYRNLRGSEARVMQAEKKALGSEAELNAVQASVNPHFLYNSLNSIASLATVDPTKTEAMAMALSSFYKYTTNRKEQHLTTVKEEMEMVGNYLEIEKIRFGERLQYNIDFSEECAGYHLPRFLLQPLAENAVKYGFDEKTEKIALSISAQIESLTPTFLSSGEEKLVIRIFDDGSDFDENLQAGYGLRSVSKKLQLLFPDQHQLQFKNAPKKHIFITLSKV